MSELFDDEPEDLPPSRSSRRVVWVVVAAVVVVVAFFAVTAFASIDTDRLWYDALDYSSVWRRLFWTRTGLFLGAGAVMTAVVGGSMVLAFASRPFYHPSDEHGPLARYRDAVDPVRRWLLIGVAGLCGIFAGVSGAGSWRTWMLWRHGVTWGQKDPYFHKDIGFYVFTLPWWHYVVNFGLTALLLAALASLGVHYLYGGIRLSSERDRFSGPAQVQLSVILGLLLVVKAIDYWLDRYDLVHSDGPLFSGIGYTDDHAVLPGKHILAVITLICAALFFLNVWRRRWLAPVTGIAALLVSAIILGLIWPVIVQGFEVKPAQATKEAGYLAANYAATQTAYGISGVEQKPYQPSATSPTPSKTSTTSSRKALAAELDQQTSEASVVDPSLAWKEFDQTQERGKSYYSTDQTLDVDHYEIDGHDRALDLGVRELDQTGLAPNARSWDDLHTVYTHGDALIASYANQRDSSDTTEETSTQYAEGDGKHDLPTFRRQVYFGEDSPDYSVVGAASGSKPVEADVNDDGTTDTTTYTGDGGVRLSSGLRRFLYAVKFGSADFLFSHRVSDSSQVLYDRTPLERVHQVAPWLTLDSDPYPVVVDHHLEWVVDGYTTTDLYPDSQRSSYTAMTSDASATNPDAPPSSDDQINYLRDAVKATVDAYTGKVTIYAWDPTDPILETWESAFPGVVQARSEIPPDLLSHLRYPTGQFEVQRYQLERYHDVSDPAQLITDGERWDIPDDPNNPGLSVTPYRTFLDQDGHTTWSIASTLVPYQKSDLAALMTVDSNGADRSGYGRIELLTEPSGQVPGPVQLQQQFAADTAITDKIAKLSRSATSPSYGAIETIPTEEGMVAIEPVYATRSATSGYPTLAYVLVWYDGHDGIGTTLRAAFENALTSSASSTSGGGSGGGSPPARKQADRLLVRAHRLLAQADRLRARARQADKTGQHALSAGLQDRAWREVRRAEALLAPGS